MLEDAEIERLLVRLDAPGNSVIGLDRDPADEVRLLRASRVISYSDWDFSWAHSRDVLPCYGFPALPWPP